METKGGLFDLQKFMGYMPGFTWAKYRNEHHFKNYNYLGPQSALDIRLNPDGTPKPGEEPINQTDYQAYLHDLKYQSADKLPPDEALKKKLEADKIMIAALEEIEPESINERLANFVSRKILSMKVKLGVGIDDPLSPERAHIVAKELHTPLKKQNRRSIIVNFLNEIHSIDLIELPPEKMGRKTYKYVLMYIDVFSKKLTAYALTSKSAPEIIATLKMQFSLAKPVKLWGDKEAAFYSKECLKFLKDEGVQLYSTESEVKGSIIERANRSIKDRLERIKTEKELQGLKFSWLQELPGVISLYNNTVHRTIRMTPNEAQNPDPKVQEKIKMVYLRKQLRNIFLDKGPVYKIGDKIRLWKYRATFTKGFREKWTKEIFVIYKVNLTDHPTTYEITNLSGDEKIKGKIYSHDMIKSLS